MGIGQTLRNMLIGQETIVLPRQELVQRRSVAFETIAPQPLVTVTSNGIEVSVDLHNLLGATPVQLYRSQPYLRAVVDFLARNIAQLGIHVYERLSDTDRVRSTDSVTAKLLKSPNDYTTRYELINALVSDLALWDEAFWLVTPDSKREPGWRITPVPVAWMNRPLGGNYWEPEYWEINRPNKPTEKVLAKNVLHFHGWDPESIHHGISPVETLKNILAEQVAAVLYRQQRWERGGRVGHVITRPAGAPAWSEQAEDRFRREWRNSYAGASGTDSGGTPILQDGMVLSKVGFSAVEDEFVEANKLALTTVASVYHVNPTMLGLLDNANYSNVREFRRMLYGDTLGPSLAMIEDRLNAFMVTRVEDDANTKLYVEFNINEKLQGSFEEQATVANMAVGGPYMTRNEYRIRQNLPPIEGGDELIVPLNVAEGAGSTPAPALSVPLPAARSAGQLRHSGTKVRVGVQVRARASNSQHNRVQRVLVQNYRRQARAVLPRLKSKTNDEWWPAERFDKELAADLIAIAAELDIELGSDVLADLNATLDYDATLNEELIAKAMTVRAEWINKTTKDALDAAELAQAEGDEDAPTAQDVFANAESERAGTGAVSICTVLAGMAAKSAGRQAAPDGGATKTWRVTSKNSRHPNLNNQTVDIEAKFSNGADWPGDAILGPDQTSGCHCELIINLP